MYDPEFDPQPVFRVSSEEINLVLAKLHREKVMRVVAINSKIIKLEVENFPEALPVIELAVAVADPKLIKE